MNQAAVLELPKNQFQPQKISLHAQEARVKCGCGRTLYDRTDGTIRSRVAKITRGDLWVRCRCNLWTRL